MRAGSHMRANRFSVTLFASVGLFVLLQSRGVVAQSDSSTREQADALFEQGKAALKLGDWLTACTQFQRSRELDESPSTLVKIARCYEHDGRFLQALAEYDRALSLIRARPASDVHARDLESLIRSSSTGVEGRLARLRIRLNPQPSRAVVLVDGQALRTFENSQTELMVPVDPGKHSVQIEAAGYSPTSPSHLELAERQQLDLSISLTPTSATSSGPASQDATPAPVASVQPPLQRAERKSADYSSTGRTQRLVGYVTGGAGIVLAVVAGYFGVRTRSYVNDARADNHCDVNYRCDRRGLELIDDARDQQRNAIIASAASGVLVTTGIVLVATAPGRRSEANGTKRTLALSVSPFGAAVGGQW